MVVFGGSNGFVGYGFVLRFINQVIVWSICGLEGSHVVRGVVE